MSMAWIRKNYGAPAKVGGRIEYTGNDKAEHGTITGTRNGRLRIRLDGVSHSILFHPTWKLRYF